MARIGCALIVLLMWASYAFAAAPVIFFSDLTSGPKTGGQNNKGVFVTIWGKNFGATRGTSTVAIGGGNADNYPEWSDTKVCFQLGANAATGNIVLTKNGVASNGVAFTVRSGNIYFVTPTGTGDGSYASPFGPEDYTALLYAGEDGATAYFRAGTYSGEYAHTGWYANFTLRTQHSGSSGNENAFIAYPGETASLVANSAPASRNNFRLYDTSTHYIVVAKMNMWAQRDSITAHTGWRIIGNTVNAIHEFTGAGCIGAGGYQDATPHHIYIYGNEITGGSSGNKLDHAIYPGSGVNYLYVGWNYVHGNNFGEGPMVSLNSNAAAANNLVSQNVYFHDNVIDVTDYPSRVFGVFEVGDGSDITYYNNVIIGQSISAGVAVYALSGNVHYYNNTLYNTGNNNGGASFSFYSSTESGHAYAPESIELKNNIIYSASDAVYYVKLTGTAPEPTISNNLFYGIASPLEADRYDADANRVTSNPLFVSTTDFHLQSSSPAKNAGTSVAIVTMDIEGVTRDSIDIGAYEYPPTGGVFTATGTGGIGAGGTGAFQ